LELLDRCGRFRGVGLDAAARVEARAVERPSVALAFETVFAAPARLEAVLLAPDAPVWRRFPLSAYAPRAATAPTVSLVKSDITGAPGRGDR
jgi:nucleoid-associated protein YgaU